MMYTFEYPTTERGMILAPFPSTRDIATYNLLQHIFSFGWKARDIRHFGDGFWTRSGVYLGRIVAVGEGK